MSYSTRLLLLIIGVRFKKMQVGNLQRDAYTQVPVVNEKADELEIARQIIQYRHSYHLLREFEKRKKNDLSLLVT